MKRLVIALMLMFIVTSNAPARAQDIHVAHRVRALKGLTKVALVMRPTMQPEIMPNKEIGDMLEVMLSRAAPELGRLPTTNVARDWLELALTSTDHGFAVELSLYRWTRVVDTGEQVFSTVWSDARYGFGASSKNAIRDSTDALVTAFAADYSRAKR